MTVYSHYLEMWEVNSSGNTQKRSDLSIGEWDLGVWMAGARGSYFFIENILLTFHFKNLRYVLFSPKNNYE